MRQWTWMSTIFGRAHPMCLATLENLKCQHGRNETKKHSNSLRTDTRIAIHYAPVYQLASTCNDAIPWRSSREFTSSMRQILSLLQRPTISLISSCFQGPQPSASALFLPLHFSCFHVHCHVEVNSQHKKVYDDIKTTVKLLPQCKH